MQPLSKQPIFGHFRPTPPKTPQKLPAKNLPKTPQKPQRQKSAKNLGYTITRFYALSIFPYIYFFFRFFLQTPSRIEKNREIASPR